MMVYVCEVPQSDSRKYLTVSPFAENGSLVAADPVGALFCSWQQAASTSGQACESEPEQGTTSYQQQEVEAHIWGRNIRAQSSKFCILAMLLWSPGTKLLSEGAEYKLTVLGRQMKIDRRKRSWEEGSRVPGMGKQDLLFRQPKQQALNERGERIKCKQKQM